MLKSESQALDLPKADLNLKLKIIQYFPQTFKYQLKPLFFMRRDYEKGQRTKKLMVYFIAFIMISSVFGVLFYGFSSSGKRELDYEDFKFINRGNFWVSNINGVAALFTYFPADVENIKADAKAIDRLKNVAEIDTSSNFNDTFAEQIALAEYQMGITLNNFNIFTRAGFTAQNKYKANIITCTNSTKFVPVIFFKSSNETKITLENDCVIAEAAKKEDVIKIKDRLAYGIFDIIK